MDSSHRKMDRDGTPEGNPLNFTSSTKPVTKSPPPVRASGNSCPCGTPRTPLPPVTDDSQNRTPPGRRLACREHPLSARFPAEVSSPGFSLHTGRTWKGEGVTWIMVRNGTLPPWPGGFVIHFSLSPLCWLLRGLPLPFCPPSPRLLPLQTQTQDRVGGSGPGCPRRSCPRPSEH